MTSNNFQTLRQTIEEGCGAFDDYKCVGKYVKDKGLCLECKAKLSLLNEIEKMIKEKINKKIKAINYVGWNEDWKRGCEVGLMELKTSLGISEGANK